MAKISTVKSTDPSTSNKPISNEWGGIGGSDSRKGGLHCKVEPLPGMRGPPLKPAKKPVTEPLRPGARWNPVPDDPVAPDGPQDSASDHPVTPDVCWTTKL